MSQATLIDGKAIAAGLRSWIGEQIAQLTSKHGLKPGLAVVLVGEDPASQVYVRSKRKTAVKLGMESFEHTLPADVDQQTVLALVQQLNDDPKVHGILVQLPLPAHLDDKPVILAIDPLKDADGLHPENAGRLMAGETGMVSCTPLGCQLLLRRQIGDMTGKDAVVIGRSLLFGKPMAQLLLSENCTVTTAHSRTADLAGHCRRADILVAAVGRPEMVKADWVKPGAVVIDVGINRLPGDGDKDRLVGDVDFDAVSSVASAITPVPGGVGPMTIACLMFNALRAVRLQNGLEDVALPTSF
ncbi:MAG: bifunctional methylenetetrahydrofolate dehydrogenase/methenyltetrahydrofolate cyclohydrolase FolD [Rhodospirillaceae bacterium]|jgi:methylenetetrahydrofolate dehydrogenase (NADP+) / methenyltetrahydrofolate cyclohydrolase|nr:bifunctional methylenetetrahydrofolate dehydrogenase/methenyltetrahydrofolate cyclohydrolase FolD [Rhodospirillaceae bacterium]MBT5240516.1 bifunctional methylenetetrahydrofolate dehydrogenase/methenyltetrahydrofolate cyclohydrolase FolD [Rhodospirillaceae bacterium]MBT5564919.1 bifunctional methylenetetrahydrofolate dehydrogenase/methenyltetrahydrofolate cyclohydrolase FolD [Rhodospirillaceae bacterium]MBT6090540.1 bifunctional methylenetetrahydrofolate dehydrogenase/methenyltetrahydrofolate